MIGVAGLVAVLRTSEAGETGDEALRIVRARAVARAEIDAFLAVNEVSSFAPSKCAALVRAWGALASMESLVRRDRSTPPAMPRALADVPDDFVASVFACAQSEPWVEVAAPSDWQLDGHGRLLRQALAGLDRRAKRVAPAPRLPWRALRGASLAVLGLALAAACVGFALYRPRWRAAYYANDRLSGDPSIVTRALEADSYWGRGGPGLAMPTDHFSARFATCLVTDRALSVLFTVGSDDGSRLFVDDRKVIDGWSAQPYTERAQPVALDPGVHTLRLEYFEREGQARLTFAGRVEGSGADITPMLRLPRAVDPATDGCKAP
jgi:hypothetical protein